MKNYVKTIRFSRIFRVEHVVNKKTNLIMYKIFYIGFAKILEWKMLGKYRTKKNNFQLFDQVDFLRGLG